MAESSFSYKIFIRRNCFFILIDCIIFWIELIDGLSNYSTTIIQYPPLIDICLLMSKVTVSFAKKLDYISALPHFITFNPKCLLLLLLRISPCTEFGGLILCLTCRLGLMVANRVYVKRSQQLTWKILRQIKMRKNI